MSLERVTVTDEHLNDFAHRLNQYPGISGNYTGLRAIAGTNGVLAWIFECASNSCPPECEHTMRGDRSEVLAKKLSCHLGIGWVGGPVRCSDPAH